MRTTILLWAARAICIAVGLLGWLWLWLEDVVEGRISIVSLGMDG